MRKIRMIRTSIRRQVYKKVSDEVAAMNINHLSHWARHGMEDMYPFDAAIYPDLTPNYVMAALEAYQQD